MVAILVPFLSGCTSVQITVIPGPHSSTILATAANQSTAYEGAVEKAQAVCKLQAKRPVVLMHRVVYQGAGKELGAVTDVLSATSMFTGGPRLSTRSNEDNRVTLKFKCR